jgi:hypothetical protein
VPPTITIKPVRDQRGKAAGIIASVDGRGNATVRIPARIGVPAIVHAQHDGGGRFVVTATDAAGHPLGTPAQSLGTYSGTFPVGFVDQAGVPTTALEIQTGDAWHLDIAHAVLAPALTGAGVSGHGDAVLSYAGPAVTAHVTASAATPFTIRTFERGATSVLAATIGPYDARITLPEGPAFVSVTTTGDWSMSLG